MKSTLLIAGVFALVLALLVGLSAMTVSAQGPGGTATPTATAVPGAGATPAQAPPAAAAGTNRDDPAAAATLGSAVTSIPGNSVQWYRFDYQTAGNQLPRPTVTIRMPNGVTNGLGFEVWSPERLVGNFLDNHPVGRGTPERLPNCSENCFTNDLTWTGGFGLDGVYYVRVVNNTDKALAPQLIFSGGGLAQCLTTQTQTQTQPTTQGTDQGFIRVQCPGQEQAAAAAAAVSPTPAAGAATPAPTQAPAAAAATSTPATSPTTAATSMPAATAAATNTPAAAPTTAGGTTPAAAATSAATSAATATTSATSAATPPAAGTSAPAGQQVVLTFGPGRDATQKGTATLVGQGDKTLVTLDMEPMDATTPQPAHIHEGSCPGVGAVKYPLTNVVNGKSVTTVNASLSSLLAGGFSMNVHKSAAESNVYTACAAVK